MANLTLVSPLRGWCAPLDEAPDAVFAQRLLGDGVAIDPTDGVLCAPCAGEVISVAAAKTRRRRSAPGWFSAAKRPESPVRAAALG